MIIILTYNKMDDIDIWNLDHFRSSVNTNLPDHAQTYFYRGYKIYYDFIGDTCVDGYILLTKIYSNEYGEKYKVANGLHDFIISKKNIGTYNSVDDKNMYKVYLYLEDAKKNITNPDECIFRVKMFTEDSILKYKYAFGYIWYGRFIN